LQSRIIALSLQGEDRPATLPEQGLRTTHIQRDDIDLVGFNGYSPSSGTALSLSSQVSRSELTGLNGIGTFATIAEEHVDGVLSWSGDWRERHHLQATWRVQQSAGSSSYSNVTGELFQRHLRMQWWSLEDKIDFDPSGDLHLVLGRTHGTVADYRFAPQGSSPDVEESALWGSGEWLVPIGEEWICGLGGSIHTRPLTYLEHLYLAQDLALMEKGRSLHASMRRSSATWEVEAGARLTHWSKRAHFTQLSMTTPYDWAVSLNRERQGSLHVDASAKLGPWRGWTGWRLDGGDLPSGSLWKNSLNSGATWLWHHSQRPLALETDVVLQAEHDGGSWNAALSWTGRIQITDDFEIGLDGRNIGHRGEVYGPQYSMALTWVLWD
jgi:hypothetical protein